MRMLVTSNIDNSNVKAMSKLLTRTRLLDYYHHIHSPLQTIILVFVRYVWILFLSAVCSIDNCMIIPCHHLLCICLLPVDNLSFVNGEIVENHWWKINNITWIHFGLYVSGMVGSWMLRPAATNDETNAMRMSCFWRKYTGKYRFPIINSKFQRCAWTEI